MLPRDTCKLRSFHALRLGVEVWFHPVRERREGGREGGREREGEGKGERGVWLDPTQN